MNPQSAPNDPSGKTSNHQPGICSLVLCGGQGSRMGGRDKPLLEWRGEPLVAHVLRALPAGPVLLSANRNAERYAHFGWPVIADKTPQLGPLGGIQAAAKAIKCDWLYVVPGDTPSLPVDLAALLRSTCEQTGSSAASVIAGRIHPLPLLVHKKELHGLEGYLESGQRSVLGWLATLTHVSLDQAHRKAAFVNINTSEELQALDP